MDENLFLNLLPMTKWPNRAQLTDYNGHQEYAGSGRFSFIYVTTKIAISLWAFKPKVYGRKFIFKFASYDPNGPTEHS